MPISNFGKTIYPFLDLGTKVYQNLTRGRNSGLFHMVFVEI